MRLNHADVTVRLPHAVSSGKCEVRSGLLDQKEISRFIANSPELAGIRACNLCRGEIPKSNNLLKNLR